MDAPCAACVKYPAGAAGHDDLTVRTVGEHRLSFQCDRCGLFWARSTSKKTDFAWTPMNRHKALATQLGLRLPPRSGSTLH